jgi:hypothetical protein
MVGTATAPMVDSFKSINWGFGALLDVLDPFLKGL